MAIDAKDQITHGHIRRVQRLAVGLARSVGVNDETQIKAIEAAALLHDMGKLAIPEFILNKPGRLTPSEFDVMKQHANIGADILGSIHFPYPVVPIVRHHHEAWDGSGYPNRLKGVAIPLGARILSVVDCFDALTSDRPYRPALSVDDAIAVLVQRRGVMYDPLIVDKFIEAQAQLSEFAASDAAEKEVIDTLATKLRIVPEPPASNTAGHELWITAEGADTPQVHQTVTERYFYGRSWRNRLKATRQAHGIFGDRVVFSDRERARDQVPIR